MEMAIKDTLQLQGATGSTAKFKKMRELGDKNSAIDAANQIMLIMTAISRAQSATILVKNSHIYGKCNKNKCKKEA